MPPAVIQLMIKFKIKVNLSRKFTSFGGLRAFSLSLVIFSLLLLFTALAKQASAVELDCPFSVEELTAIANFESDRLWPLETIDENKLRSKKGDHRVPIVFQNKSGHIVTISRIDAKGDWHPTFQLQNGKKTKSRLTSEGSLWAVTDLNLGVVYQVFKPRPNRPNALIEPASAEIIPLR